MQKALDYKDWRNFEKDKGIQVRYEKETLWMTQKVIAELFDVQRPAIKKHLNNILMKMNWIKMQYVPFWNILLKMEKNIKQNIII